ncbi:hypothetical protein [Chelativorans salis]|uniref:Uncharacterized protein n=1 Tax=Chelativorans salis TaxID=2978478 RepID=A0ABT2LHZ6_9HYPH|nr:hypothetical protein [Chelativorans sp. EGI FJ00035]MCT7374130.1 hypothetical protein [Chelativorans sp. EGI FJ00035]
MRPLPDLAIWGLAAAASLAIHGSLAAWLVLLPAPNRAAEGETMIAVHAMPSSLPQSVNSGMALRPVEAAGTVAAEGGTLKSIAKARTGGEEADLLRPATTASAALSPTAAGREIGGTEADPVPAAAISERRVARESAAAPRAAQPPPGEASPVLKPSATGGSVRASTAASAAAPRADREAAVLDARTAGGAEIAQSPAPGVIASVPLAEQPNRTAPVATSAAGAQPPHASAEKKVAARALPPAGADAVRHRGGAPAIAAEERVTVVAPAEREVPSAQSASPSSGTTEAVAVVVPPKPLPPARVQEVDPYTQVLEYLAGYDADNCFLALPSRGKGGRVTIDGFALKPAEVSRFTAELASLTGVDVEPSGHSVSPDQCRALSFARGLAAYPTPGLSIRLEAQSIRSGTYLSGQVGNLRRGMLYLIVIDDEGKVQEIDQLFQGAAGEIGFEAPMTLTRGPVETVQLLLAVASDVPLTTFASHEGETAETYFAALAEEIGRTETAVDFGFTFFFVN